MDIPTDAKVECTDGSGGHVTGIIIDPPSRKVTHLIVKGPGLFSHHKMVDITSVASVEQGVVKLDIVRDMLDAMPTHLKPDDYKRNSPMVHHQAAEQMDLQSNWWQFDYPSDVPVGDPNFNPTASDAVIEQPRDEVVADNHIKVEATDGSIGKLAGLEVADDMTVTYLLIKAGGHNDVKIPMTSVDYVSKGVVYLTVNKEEAEVQS